MGFWLNKDGPFFAWSACSSTFPRICNSPRIRKKNRIGFSQNAVLCNSALYTCFTACFYLLQDSFFLQRVAALPKSASKATPARIQTGLVPSPVGGASGVDSSGISSESEEGGFKGVDSSGISSGSEEGGSKGVDSSGISSVSLGSCGVGTVFTGSPNSSRVASPSFVSPW